MQLYVAHFDGDLFLANVHVGVADRVVRFHAQLAFSFRNETGNLFKQKLVKAVDLHAHKPLVLEVQLDNVPCVSLSGDGDEWGILLNIKLRSLHAMMNEEYITTTQSQLLVSHQTPLTFR